MLSTALIAFAIGMLLLVARNHRLQANLTAKSLAYTEQVVAADLREKAVQAEFFGRHGDLVIAVHLRDSVSRPLLFKTTNVMDGGHDMDTITGNSGNPLKVSESSALFGKTKWSFGGHIQLMRSVDDTDYYRLIFHPTRRLEIQSSLDYNIKDKRNGEETTVLFEYDGQPKLVHSDETLLIMAGQDRKSVVDALIDFYPKDEGKKMRENWYKPFPPVVKTMLREGVRY